MLMQNDELHEVAAVFNNSASAHDDVAKAGETFLLALYGFSTCDSLDRLRYFTYSSKVAHHNLQTEFNLASLSPTTAAARQH